MHLAITPHYDLAYRSITMESDSMSILGGKVSYHKGGCPFTFLCLRRAQGHYDLVIIAIISCSCFVPSPHLRCPTPPRSPPPRARTRKSASSARHRASVSLDVNFSRVIPGYQPSSFKLSCLWPPQWFDEPIVLAAVPSSRNTFPSSSASITNPVFATPYRLALPASSRCPECGLASGMVAVLAYFSVLVRLRPR